MDHDRLFKQLLTEFFADFLRLFVPDLATQLDDTELVPLDKELLGDKPPGQRHEVDLLVRARVRDEPATFLIHVEAQAQHQPDFARRMFRYFARLHEAHGKPVYPIAVLAHERPRRASPTVYEVRAAGDEVLRFRFRAIQLNLLRWQDFRDTPNPVAAALMARTHIDRADRPRVKCECYRMTVALNLQPRRKARVLEFVEAYLRLDEAEHAMFTALVDASAPDVKEVVMEYSNQWIEKGLRQGRQEGRHEGRQEGRVEGRLEGRQERGHELALDMLLRLLTRRFGPVPEATRQALAALPEERLVALAESIFELKGLADLDV